MCNFWTESLAISRLERDGKFGVIVGAWVTTGNVIYIKLVFNTHLWHWEYKWPKWTTLGPLWLVVATIQTKLKKLIPKKFGGNGWKSGKIRNPHNMNGAMCRTHRSQAEVSSRFAHSSGLRRRRTWNYMKRVRCDEAGCREATSIKERVLRLDTPTLAGQSLGEESLLQPSDPEFPVLSISCTQLSQSVHLVSFVPEPWDLGNHNSKFCHSWILFRVLGLHQN